MIFGQKKAPVIEESELSVPLFGYRLLKDELLPDLLGKEHTIILYWAGKSLARKHPLSTIEEISHFFQRAGWGDLHLVKEKKAELLFELTSNLFEHKKERSYSLEAGFLAEQIQLIKGYMAEANEELKSGGKKAIFCVRWDLHDERS